jgi:hypothetical protein
MATPPENSLDPRTGNFVPMNRDSLDRNREARDLGGTIVGRNRHNEGNAA